MSRRSALACHSLALVSLALSSCSSQDAPTYASAQISPRLECAADTSCKGDRICVNGTCQAPPSRQTATSAPISAGPTGEPHYSGVPSKDEGFANFIEQNIGKVVTLDVLTPDENGDSMPEGYRGGTPSFMGKPVSGTNRQFMVECEAPDDPMTHSVEDCGKAVSWENVRSRLQGRFRVAGVEKDPAVWIYTLKPEQQ